MNENLPIFKATLDLIVYVDGIVKNQERYYKYSIGKELRESAMEMLFLIGRANRARDNRRVEILKELIEECEKVKLLTVLAKELKALKSFKQFEHTSKLTVMVCKQAQAWLKSMIRS